MYICKLNHTSMATKHGTHDPELAKRAVAVMRWAQKRRAKQPIALLVGLDPSLRKHDNRMKYVRTHADPNIKQSDEAWITRCEEMISRLG